MTLVVLYDLFKLVRRVASYGKLSFKKLLIFFLFFHIVRVGEFVRHYLELLQEGHQGLPQLEHSINILLRRSSFILKCKHSKMVE